MNNQIPNTTTDAGTPVPSDEHSLTVGAGGPNVLQDAYLIEKLAHVVRERIPDRVYHVKGGGAFGYFEVTADVTQWTKAAFFNNVGKRTPMLARFSLVAGGGGLPRHGPRRARRRRQVRHRGGATTTSSATTRRSFSCATR